MLTNIGRQSLKYYKNTAFSITVQANLHENASTIEHFTSFKNEWWDEMGVMKPLHSLNKLRVPLIRDGLINTGSVQKHFINTPQPLTNLQILEVGCGGGILTEALSRLGCCVTGIDAATDLIKVAKEHSSNKDLLKGINYYSTTIEKFAEDNMEKFDAVVASEVLEHVDGKDSFLEACVKCLKPEGSIFITTINQTLTSWLLVVAMAENVIRIIPQGTHFYDKFIAPHRTQKILEHNNCKTRLVHGYFYNFVTNSWSWSTNTSVHYAIHAVKI